MGNFEPLAERRFQSRTHSVVVPMKAVLCVLTITGPSGLDGQSDTVLDVYRTATSY